MQEEISKAYVHMVASAAGVTLLDWRTDYGAIDVTVKSLVDYSCIGGFQPQFDLQLKCTFQDGSNRQGDHLSWQVNRRTYEKLANPNRATPAILGVMVVPEEPGLWLDHNTEGLLARSHMYWIRAKDFPSLPDGQESKTISIPKANILSAGAVLNLMQEASERWLS
jgi:hypothetical protein